MPRRGICAHRGAGATHPENTLSAFREAIRLGAHEIELDVQLLADGGLAVIHDRTVDRTTDGHGPVAGFTTETIKRLDAHGWKHSRFAGTHVPTLAESLAIMPRNVWINVHLKEDNKQLGTAVAREILRQKRTHQAFLACGHAAADAACEVSPDVLICNMERQGDNDSYVLDTIQRRCRFIQFSRKLGTPRQIDQLKRAGVSINYYGTNDVNELAQLFAAGVDFPLVDHVAEMLQAARPLGIEPLEQPRVRRDAPCRSGQ
jgi:glycerophosphoryl diester phosphodiesterase